MVFINKFALLNGEIAFNVSKILNKHLRGKLALHFLILPSDNVKLWCLSSECLGSNLAIVKPSEGDDNIATLTSVSMLATTISFLRLKVVIGFASESFSWNILLAQ